MLIRIHLWRGFISQARTERSSEVSTAPTMKLLVVSASALVLLGQLIQAQPANDPSLDMDEKEFEEYFHLDPVTDPEELAKRNEALKESEDEIKNVNDEYAKGDLTWYDGLNEFSDLPADEFLEEKTGAIIPENFGRGLLAPTKEQEVDEESERYFDQVRMDRASVPSSYSSLARGL